VRDGQDDGPDPAFAASTYKPRAQPLFFVLLYPRKCTDLFTNLYNLMCLLPGKTEKSFKSRRRGWESDTNLKMFPMQFREINEGIIYDALMDLLNPLATWQIHRYKKETHNEKKRRYLGPASEAPI